MHIITIKAISSILMTSLLLIVRQKHLTLHKKKKKKIGFFYYLHVALVGKIPAIPSVTVFQNTHAGILL